MLLAHGSPAIDLLAVTTVAGNQTLEKVTRNALAVAEIAGIHVPIAAGCDRPLVRPREIAPSIHGDSGMDGPVLPPPTRQADSRHAVDLIIELIMAHPPGEITLVPTGALTNIALAVRKEPRIAGRVREVVLMGGGYHTGNWSAVAEFNIKIDPEAAHIVFNTPWPLTMVGLDLTHQPWLRLKSRHALPPWQPVRPASCRSCCCSLARLTAVNRVLPGPRYTTPARWLM